MRPPPRDGYGLLEEGYRLRFLRKGAKNDGRKKGKAALSRLLYK